MMFGGNKKSPYFHQQKEQGGFNTCILKIQLSVTYFAGRYSHSELHTHLDHNPSTILSHFLF